MCVASKWLLKPTTSKEGLKLAKEKNPDVVLLDFKLPDANGFEVVRKLLRHSPDLKILVITAMENDFLPKRLLEAGVHGYLTKANSGNELERAIRLVHSGQRYLSPDIANRLALNKMAGNQTPFEKLSKREMEVLLMVAKGMDTEAIAKQLFISTKTVASNRYRIFDKLQVKNNVEAVKLAIQYGVINVASEWR